jgi:hypothetical protein
MEWNSIVLKNTTAVWNGIGAGAAGEPAIRTVRSLW